MPGDASSFRTQLETALADSYTLERELGGGGMSRVFVAEETTLGRRVVVKVLAPELTEGMSAERFAREVRVAARLQHPNIVPLLAAGKRDGLAYYTMPFVEGESLRARLAREGRLPVDAAVSVLRDVARALEYAHGHGVVHRDIKPDNILLSGSAATVADFGIAKALHSARTLGGASAEDDEAPRPRTGETLTRVGTSLGTPAYMAPEQAAGDPDVDARADLYAWGVVAYELLAGAPPFAGRTTHELVVAHIRETPPPLAERAPTTPPPLAALVMRCLEKEPARRPQSAAELLAVLDEARTPSSPSTNVHATRWSRRARVAAGVAVVALLAALGVLVARARGPSVSAPPVLAVLPFENLGPAADAYFADGLTDEVTSRLAGLSGLQVIGRSSAQQYKGTTKSLRDVARELGATHLLTGTVRWERAADGGRVRVSPQLVRASDQATLWAEPYEGPLGSVFQVQSSVAERVAAALDVALLAAERRTVAAPATANLGAYDAYLRGLAGIGRSLRYTSPSMRTTAIVELERAVALDPTFAAAHAALTRAYLSAYFFATDPALLAKAKASRERAVALAPGQLDVLLASSEYLVAAGDNDGAARAVEAAARLAPNNAAVLYQLGDVQQARTEWEAAAETYRRAERLDPRSPEPPAKLSGNLDLLGRHEEAIRVREREIALSPDNTIAYAGQAISYLLWNADTAAARRTLERATGPSGIAVLTRLPDMNVAIGLWGAVLPAAVIRAKDTLSYQGYAAAGDTSHALYHLMKLRHAVRVDRPAMVRAHADSLILFLEPALRAHPEMWGRRLWRFSPAAILAEAYVYAGRLAEAGQTIDRFVPVAEREADAFIKSLPGAEAARLDVLAGRPDRAVERLDALLRQHSGFVISRAILRADPTWAPLRGRPDFERLIAE